MEKGWVEREEIGRWKGEKVSKLGRFMPFLNVYERGGARSLVSCPKEAQDLYQQSGELRERKIR